MATPTEEVTTEQATTEQSMTEEATTEPATAEPKRREIREFRLMYRPTSSVSIGDAKPKNPSPLRRKISRQIGRSAGSRSLVGDLCAKLAEKSGHWALVVLKPTEPVAGGDSPGLLPTPNNRCRTPIQCDDARIDRVFEICHPRRPAAVPVDSEKPQSSHAEYSDDDDSVADLKAEQPSRSSWSWPKKLAAKSGLSTGVLTECNPNTGLSTGVPKGCDPKPPGWQPTTPHDSDEDDRYDSDEDGFRESNIKGKTLKMQISHLPRDDFSELRFEHLGGTVWEILTGIEARTKFTNSELRCQAQRVWKRQQDYHLLDNNCQQFCVLLAIEIRVKSHYHLLDHHCNTVTRQIKGMKFDVNRK